MVYTKLLHAYCLFSETEISLMKKHFILFFCGLFFTSVLFAQSPKKLRKQAEADFAAKKYTEAIEGYSKVNALKPNNYKVLLKRAMCYELTKQPTKAIEDYLACNKLEPKNKELYIKVADLYISLGDFTNANIQLDRLLLFDKWHIDGLQKSAWCHIMLKEYEKAIEKTDRAIEEESHGDGKTTEISHYYRGLAKDSLKDYSAAILSYKRAITIFKFREVNRVKAKAQYKPYYTNLGRALFLVKQYDESIKNYEIASTIDLQDTVLPKNFYVYYLRSFPYLAKTDFNSAIGDLNKAIVMEPKIGYLFFQRGLIYKQTSQFQSAISDFTKTILLDENYGIAHLYKAQCLMELANFKEAISETKKFLKMSPNHKEALALLKDAEEKNYNANKENDPPIIKWSYPFIDQNNFINVFTNQVNVVLEGEIVDKSFLKSVTINGREMSLNAEELNPQYKFKLPTDNLKKIEMVVTDIYNNATAKTVKVGKVVSDTRVVVTMEGIILSDDNSNTPLANKNIYITNQKGEQFLATTTDEKGYFKFRNLPFDKDYLIEIEGQDEISLQSKGFVLADKNGKHVLKSSAGGKNKFHFELLQTDLVALSLMEIDDVALNINISGKLYGLMPSQTPLNNINVQLVKSNGEVIMKRTDANGFFSFSNVNPGESFSFKIDENEAKNIPTSTIVITDIKGQVIKTVQKNQYGFFEYKLLETEKSQMSSISEPDPWLKITTLNKEKKQLEIIENIYYESGSYSVPKNAEEILMKAVEALSANPKLTLEIESHTDAIASDDFNMDLSQKRAAKVVEFIEQKGIDSYRLIPKGMGESLIINHCSNGVDCSDGEHKQNRRTVFKLTYNENPVSKSTGAKTKGKAKK